MDKITEEFYGFQSWNLGESSKTIKEGMEDVYNNTYVVAAQNLVQLEENI